MSMTVLACVKSSVLLFAAAAVPHQQRILTREDNLGGLEGRRQLQALQPSVLHRSVQASLDRSLACF